MPYKSKYFGLIENLESQAQIYSDMNYMSQAQRLNQIWCHLLGKRDKLLVKVSFQQILTLTRMWVGGIEFYSDHQCDLYLLLIFISRPSLGGELGSSVWSLFFLLNFYPARDTAVNISDWDLDVDPIRELDLRIDLASSDKNSDI